MHKDNIECVLTIIELDQLQELQPIYLSIYLSISFFYLWAYSFWKDHHLSIYLSISIYIFLSLSLLSTQIPPLPQPTSPFIYLPRRSALTPR